MADRASHATKPSESDFHDSHPLDEDNSPSLGDLTSIDSLPDADNSEAKSMGDINAVDAPGEDDVLGDITLLEEAFAEMEEGDEAEAAEAEVSIPVLDESVHEPTSDSEPEEVSIDPNQSVPVLEQQATVFAEAQSDSSTVSVESENNEQDASDSDSALEALLGEEETISQSVEEESDDVASVFAEQDDNAVDEITDNSFPAIESSHEPSESAMDGLSDSKIDDVANDEVLTTTVDDKIALATGEDNTSEIIDVPLSEGVTQFEAEEESEEVSKVTQFEAEEASEKVSEEVSEATSNAEDPYAGLPSDFADNDDDVPLSTVVSTIEDAGESEHALTQATHTEHKLTVGQSNEISFNVPFELHAQLSKKIDELVIDATTSLTNELQNHLSNRMEVLLAQSVEMVLPNLVNQMVSGLQSEVKQRINEQLPHIINEVLGKTSLKDK